jgi:hypothetical protein
VTTNAAPVTTSSGFIQTSEHRRFALALAPSQFDRPAWLPVLVLSTGWSAAWLAGFALAASPALKDLAASIYVALVGWVVAGPLIGAGLRWAAPEVPLGRAVLLSVGWPACIVVGVVGPSGLHVGGWGAAILGVCIAVAGALAGLVLAPVGLPVQWDRVLVVAAAWSAGWLWFGVTAWSEVIARLAEGSASTYGEMVSYVPLTALASGPVFSGLSGGVVAYFTLRRPMPPAS